MTRTRRILYTLGLIDDPAVPAQPIERATPWLVGLLVLLMAASTMAGEATSSPTTTSTTLPIPAAVPARDSTPAPTTTAPAATTTTTQPATTTTTLAQVTTTTQPAPPAPAVPRWQPEDECGSLLRPVRSSTMRWCPAVARYLWASGHWQPGDLTRLMRIIDCESAGDPTAVNRRSGATGLFQHLPRYWSDRGAKAAAYFGFDHPTITMPLDNIAAGVWLYVTQGPRHWPTCGRR